MRSTSAIQRARSSVRATWLALAIATGAFAPASAQVTVDWVEPMGGNTIAVDAANNVYTATYTAALGAEIALTKRDVNGQLLWTVSNDQTDATKWESTPYLVVDHAGDVVVCCTLMSGYSNPVNAASVAMKFAADGTFLWRQVYESAFDGSYVKRCLVDARDDIYVLGMGSGPAGFVTKIKKFDPAGNVLWTWYDGAGIGAPVIFKLAADDQLLIAARSIYGSVNGYAKVDLAGNTVWSLPGIYSSWVGDLAGDTLGNTYVLHSEYVYNPKNVVKRLDSAGAKLWEQTYDLAAQRIEVGRDDLAIACGFPPGGGAGTAFLKIDANGAELWKNVDADGSLSLLLHAQLVLDDANAAYLAAGTLSDMAICKVNPDGTSAWTQTTAGSYAYAMALGSHDNGVFMVGGQTARLIDATGRAFTDLGRGLAGAGGIPLLWGTGDLTPSSAVELDLDGAAPNALTILVFGASRADLPLLGGTLVPSFDVAIAGLGTDAAGRWQIVNTWPAGVPAGDDFFVQTWIADLGAPRKFAATNALRLEAR